MSGHSSNDLRGLVHCHQSDEPLCGDDLQFAISTQLRRLPPRYQDNVLYSLRHSCSMSEISLQAQLSLPSSHPSSLPRVRFLKLQVSEQAAQSEERFPPRSASGVLGSASINLCQRTDQAHTGSWFPCRTSRLFSYRLGIHFRRHG
jgi:hypothetical protein